MKPDYKNWMPKGMVITFYVISILLLFIATPFLILIKFQMVYINIYLL